MRLTPSDLDNAFGELSAWCRLAQELLASDSHRTRTDEYTLLLRQTLRVHRRHQARIRSMTSGMPAPGDQALPSTRAWDEVKAAIHAGDRQVAQAACLLLQRALLAAYDRAAVLVRAHPEASQLIHEQKREIMAYYSALIRRHPAPVAPPAERAAVRESFAHSIAS